MVVLAGLYPKRYSPDAEGGGDHLLVLDSGRAGCQCCDGRIAKEAVWGLTAKASGAFRLSLTV